MKLKKFLEVTQINSLELSKKLKIPYSTFKTYVDGVSEPSLTNALKIQKATHGAVKVRDLIIKR